MSATVRFSELVTSSGKPQLHTLWGPPEKDPEFQRAIKTDRVMTIHQENVGSKKDYGVIGFSKDGPAQFLVFPRSLKRFHGRRVVGIKYEAFDVHPTVHKPEPRSVKDPRSRPTKAKSVEVVPTDLAAAPTSSGHAESSEAAAAVRERAKASSLDSAERGPRGHGAREVKVQRVTKRQTGPVNRTAILKELRGAMKELEAGKAVLVFRRLENLARQLETRE